MITIPTSKYYTIREHMLEFYDENSRKYAFKAKNAQEFETWKKELRAVLADLSGIARMKACSLEPQLLESENLEGHRRDKMIIQTEKDVWMTFYVLVPDGIKQGEKRVCVIAPHGHNACGKYTTAGRAEVAAIKKAIDRYNADYGLQLVKEGYVVLCPDARGTGERREMMHQGDEEEKFMSRSCNDLNNVAISLGLSLQGMFTWDLMRLVDYAEAQDVTDSNRIGCCGFSGGGSQSLWLTLMDDRIKFIIKSGSLSGYKNNLLSSSKCGCGFIPRLWEYVDTCDLAALIAPRPMLIETGSRDSGNGKKGLKEVNEQFAVIREAYRVFDAEDRLSLHIFDNVHVYNGEKTSEFLKKWA